FIASMEGGARPTGCRIRFTLDVSPDQAYYSGGVVYMGGNYGYDDTILLHEFGHFVQYAYGGFSDNPGGSHYVNDSAQDPRLSFGEGWPTFFSCGTRDWAGYVHPQVYMNSTGDSTTGHISFSYDVETYTGGSGASCEVSITACLWDQVDGDMTADNTPGVDDEPGYQMDRTFQESWDFTRDYLSQPPFSGDLTYEDYHDIWIASVPNPQTTELLQIEQLNHGILYRDDSYENDDSFATAGGYHSFEDIGMGRTTHHTTWPQGDEDWIRFEGLAGVQYQIETLGMRDGADTYLEIRNALSVVVASNDNVASPTPGGHNAFENLRSRTSYTPATTQDLYVRIRRSPNSPWGPVSKYGNWFAKIRAVSAPSSYPNIMTNPMFSFTITLDQNDETTSILEIRNTGTVDTLHFSLAEAGGDIPWVSESPMSGAVPPGGSHLCDITFNATGMEPGDYRGTLEIHSDDPNLTVRSLTLDLTVIEVVAANDALRETDEIWIGANAPNPFEGETRIPFTLSEAGPTVLAIYDLQGREIRRLWDGPLDARTHAVTWDGLDGLGREVSSGVYLCRLLAHGRSVTRKIVLSH
ncbi:MAG: T9SS type A sorting domain-containing protein, partial [Candidatus Eisenbacteria bacterium]|nr:T9SS type A sorting domain-containing protein [Candidatus Eisenbacteria bacterium]